MRYSSVAQSLALVLAMGAGGRCMAIEQPKYSVELREPPCEVRDYAPSIVAAVEVTGSRQEAVNAGFRILAGYIFGDNQTQGKIAMTAPVTQSATQNAPAAQRAPGTPSAGESIAMTAPVEQNETPSGWEVRFTMPAAYTMSTLPKPRDARVHLLEVPGRRTAVITFSGFWSDSNLQAHVAQLREFLTQRQLTAVSPPVYAFYDPPWTPWFWRTNEVLIEVAAGGP